MKKETKYVKIDSRNRVTIPKELSQGMAHLFEVYEKDGKIILDPVHKIAKEEKWLFDPKNKAIVEELKAALKEKANRKIDLKTFE